MPNDNKALNLFFAKNNFVGSYNSLQDVPKKNNPEFCFIGRSNVGKSSIINAITKSKKLAKTSKTPGRTQSLNLFNINNKINIIDLPGYGYANLSKIRREELSTIIHNYIIDKKRSSLLFLLIDCKVGIKNNDIDILDIIINSKKSFSIILTKIDKCNLKYIDKQQQSLVSLMKNYDQSSIKIFPTSTKKNIGIIDVQKEIYNLSSS